MYLNKFNKITYLETSTILDYAKSLCDAMDSHLFKMVAHPDYFMQLPITFNHDCKIATEMIINSALKNDVILEFNANGIRKGLSDYPNKKRYPYSNIEFWEKISSANVKSIIGSDAQNPKQLFDDSVKQSYLIAKKLNLNLVDLFPNE